MGMRVYQVSTMLLYVGFGLFFLLTGNRLSVAHSGAFFTADGPALWVWGWAFLLAGGVIDWALICPTSMRARRWSLAATLFVGGAWALAGLVVTVLYGVDPSRPFFWGWVEFVHLFVYVALAPRLLPAHDPQLQPASENGDRETLGLPGPIYDFLQRLVAEEAPSIVSPPSPSPSSRPVRATGPGTGGAARNTGGV